MNEFFENAGLISIITGILFVVKKFYDHYYWQSLLDEENEDDKETRQS
ncbi:MULTISPECIES: hypothetical protein [Paenibacillus]|nr:MULTISPECIES: hypothetical protein [Paenibacillus]